MDQVYTNHYDSIFEARFITGITYTMELNVITTVTKAFGLLNIQRPGNWK